MKIIITLICILLTGCSGTPYQKYSWTGGYSETRMAEDIYVVYFSGNGGIRLEKAKDFAMLRCAELTLSSTYKYFAIIRSNVSISQSYYSTPVISNTVQNKLGSSSYYRTEFTGGDTFVFDKPFVEVVIQCFATKPKNNFVLDAEFIKNSIQKKYNLKI